jgi:hypothetical protein
METAEFHTLAEGACMRRIRSIGFYVLTTAVALVAANATALAAACPGSAIAGKWHFFAIEGQTPNIKSAPVTVRNSANNGPTTIKVFPSTGTPFENSTSTAIKCDLTLSTNGTLTSAPCTAYGVQPGDGGAVSVTGKITFGTGTTTVCAITGGTLNVPGDSTPVTILGGYVNNKQGAGIARQGSTRVYLFNIIRH